MEFLKIAKGLPPKYPFGSQLLANAHVDVSFLSVNMFLLVLLLFLLSTILCILTVDVETIWVYWCFDVWGPFVLSMLPLF